MRTLTLPEVEYLELLLAEDAASTIAEYDPDVDGEMCLDDQIVAGLLVERGAAREEHREGEEWTWDEVLITDLGKLALRVHMATEKRETP